MRATSNRKFFFQGKKRCAYRSRTRSELSAFLASRLQILRLQVIVLQFPVEGRAADPELARHRRHLPVIMGKREFYGIGLQLIERARVASCVEERKDVGIAHLH